MNPKPPEPTGSPETEPASLPASERRLTPPLPSHAVLRGQSAVDIEHNGQLYRLQTTRQGKLILTK